jgi:hypothetical protein
VACSSLAPREFRRADRWLAVPVVWDIFWIRLFELRRECGFGSTPWVSSLVLPLLDLSASGGCTLVMRGSPNLWSGRFSQQKCPVLVFWG